MVYTSNDQWLRGKVHMNNWCKSSNYNQVILVLLVVHVDVVHRPTPEPCDDSAFKIGWQWGY